jgi:hypothetical protein
LAAPPLQAPRQTENEINSIANTVNSVPRGDLRPAKIAAFKEG